MGLYTAAPDGRVFGIGDASTSTTGATLRWRLDLPLNSSVLGMAATPTGDGVWLVASDGGIFPFGDAAFYGSTGAIRLNKPIVNMAAAPHGAGYWMVASDGGVFAFGTAAFTSANPIIGAPTIGPRQRASAIVPMPTASGYWIVYSPSYLERYGTAPSYPSEGGVAAAASFPGTWWDDPATPVVFRRVDPRSPPGCRGRGGTRAGSRALGARPIRRAN